jgi:hypothetical protein
MGEQGDCSGRIVEDADFRREKPKERAEQLRWCERI